MRVLVGAVAVHGAGQPHRIAPDHTHAVTIEPGEPGDDRPCVVAAHLEELAVVDDVADERPGVVARSPVGGNDVQ